MVRNRLAHYLKGNAKRELPQHMIFVDTETKPVHISPTEQHHYLWFGWACYIRKRSKGFREWEHREWYRFTTAAQFWEWCEEKTHRKSRIRVFAHNWNFDASILSAATLPESLGWKCLTYINGKPPFIMRLRKENRTLELLDTLNYFSGSLESIGESIGYPKITMPDYDMSMGDWDTYCRRDVSVMIAAMTAFIAFVATEDLGNFRPTLASQAFGAYRHRFMDHNILISDNTEATELERDAYMGARTEAYFLGRIETPTYYLDVNSLYPSIMRDKPMPRLLRSFSTTGTAEDLRLALGHRAVIARVTLNTSIRAFPLRYAGRLCFPIGKFETTLTTPELQLALDHDLVTSVGAWATYESAHLFTTYVDTLYAARRRYVDEGNKVFAYLCKIMLNSLYGKFGQSGRVWEYVRDSDETDPLEWVEQANDHAELVTYRTRLGQVQELIKTGESAESFPGIAAHVTAYGRQTLWNAIQNAGEKNVYYMDTDSLMVSAEGYKALATQIDPVRLGAWKLENTSNRVTIYGCKDYHFGDITHRKGIRANAEQLTHNSFRQDRFTSWDAHLAKEEDGFIRIQKTVKTLSRVYRKGIPSSSGWVQPLNIGN